MRKPNKRNPLLGSALFFLTVAVTVTFAVMFYDLVRHKTDSKGVIAAVMLLIVIALTLVCTTIDYIRRKFTVERPLEKILEATDRIAHGDFGVRLLINRPYGRYDELDCIMDNLNQMAEELEKNETLANDFIANVSHELKTPLAVIQNYAVVMQDTNLTAEKRTEYAKTLSDASARLSKLVENILKLNRLEAQNGDNEIETVRVDDILAQAVLRYEKQLDEKNLELDADIDEMTARAVPSYLDIIFSNLISNAVKFTEDGGKIGISLKKYGSDIVLKVSDTGCGMSKETGTRIFDKFYQGDTSHAKEGNGLGLSLVKKVIDMMGGEISVASVLGEGTEFTIKLKETK